MSTEPQSDRYERGAAKIAAIFGEAGARVLDPLRTIAPDLADYIVEFAYGDVCSRPGLDLKSRQIATVASLVTLGYASPELRAHLHGALNVGCSRVEVMDIIIQMALYAGFPAAINSAMIAKEVFAERDALGKKDLES
jgi:4-carboxymuconolactone decarboxylase